MKKLVCTAVLALAVGAVATPSSFAWCRCFGLCPHHGCCGCGRCCGCCCNLCIRQYNAFSPCCSGTICCDGCCPLGGCGMGGACGPMGCGMGGGSCGPMGCGGPMAYSGIPVGNWPSGGAFTSQAPADPCAPAAPTAVAATAPLQPQSPIQTTTYRPYTPSRAPAAMPAPGYYRPQSAGVPSYWYDN